MSQQINLFNPVFLKQEKIFSARPMARAMGVFLLAALAVAVYGKQRLSELDKEDKILKARLAPKQARLQSVNEQFPLRQKSREIEAAISAAQADLSSLQSASAVLQRSEFGASGGYAEYFRAFARQSVAGLWLTGISISGAGAEIGVQGRALKAELVPLYIGRLTREMVLQGKLFGSLEISQPETTAEAGAALPPFIQFHLQTSASEGVLSK